MKRRKDYVIYRLYDKDMNLLYLGLSANTDKRILAHKSTKPWFPEVVLEHTRLEPVNGGKKRGLKHEKRAIIAEKPKYNRLFIVPKAPSNIADPNMRVLTVKAHYMVIDTLRAEAEKEGRFVGQQLTWILKQWYKLDLQRVSK